MRNNYFQPFLAIILSISLTTTCFGQQFLELSNANLRVKFDLTRGGAIGYISKANTDRNIVNIADEGRYIQQSYYAGKTVNRQPDGQHPAWSPWSWNPIQVGDAYRNRAQILAAEVSGNSAYVKCIPMLWDMNNKPAEATMEQWTTLSGNILHVRNKLTCHRTDNIYGENIPNHQELPAVYPISALKNLYSYFGDKPFTGAPLSHPGVVNLESGFWGRYENDMVTENWMAFVDDNNWGMGVYTPISSNFLAGMAGAPGYESHDGSTSYIAPIKTVILNKNTVFEYDYYLVIDQLNNIRSAIYQIRNGAPVGDSKLTDARVFDATFYVSYYPDLKQAFGNDVNALKNHWLNAGIREGRIAHPNFSVTAYVNRYPDLKAAFGTNYEQAILHYLNNGIAEGRTGSYQSAYCEGNVCQSSVDYGGVPSRAVDGNTDGKYSSNSVTHTKQEDNPWWSVDLGSSRDIGQIKLYNRADCCADRLSNYYVFVSDQPFGNVDLNSILASSAWRVKKTNTVGRPTSIDVNSRGRYVRIQLAGKGILSLAEVQVVQASSQTCEGVTPGVYQIIAKHSGKAVDVPGFSKENGTNMQQWDAHTGPNQQWRFECLNNGYWKITSINSGKALEVSGFGTKNGDAIQQWDWHGGTNQQWKLIRLSNGWYNIVSRNSGLSLDVAGVSTSNGAKVHQWQYVGQANQQWKLQLVGMAPVSAPEIAVKHPIIDQTTNQVELITGIGEPSAGDDISVYPNPSKDHLVINGDKLTGSRITIRDIQGRLIEVSGQQVINNSYRLNIGHLQSGIYFINVSNQFQTTTKKFIKE